MSNPEEYEVVIIGAGWAGISVSYTLKQAGFRHLVIERHRICESWRSQRWASFRMNTPNVMTVLPGDRYEGPAPEEYMTREEFVNMVENYVRNHGLPVLEHSLVEGVLPVDGGFEIRSSTDTMRARHVVVASGNLNIPARPKLADSIPSSVHQIDGAGYRSADSLPPGAVLVIGCGNTGGQIAEELVQAGRKVFLSTGRNGRVPRRYRGRDIFLWLTDTGRMGKPRTRESGRGLIGATHTISLQSLSSQGVVLLGRLSDISAEGELQFDDTLAESAAYGDEMSAMLRREIDDYIARLGLDAPGAAPDPAETVEPRFPDPPKLEIDLAAENITTLLWSTGLRGDFSWLQVPGALDENGNPAQHRCVSVKGIYFAGLDTPESLKAGTVLVAAEEAERIAEHIAANRK